MILSFVLCMTSDPTACDPHSITVEANELTCLVMAQTEIAKYARPGFTEARYGCRRME